MKKLVVLLLFAVLSIHAQDASKMVSFEGKIANRNSDSIVLASGKNFKKTLRLNKRGQFKDAFEIPSSVIRPVTYFAGIFSKAIFGDVLNQYSPSYE